MTSSLMPSSQTKYLFVFCEARVFGLYCLEVHVTFSLYDGLFRANTVGCLLKNHLPYFLAKRKLEWRGNVPIPREWILIYLSQI